MRALIFALAGCYGATSLAEEVFLGLPEAPPAQAAPADLLDDLQLNELDKADRVDQLQDQLKSLQRMLDRRRASQQPAVMPEPTPRTVPEPPEPGIPATPAHSEPEAPPSERPASSAHDLLPDQLTESASDTHHGQSELFPEGIVQGPVDRLALADSLFAGGQVDLALQAYEEVDSSTLSGEDGLWIQYQLASCYRRLLDYPEAEKRYRHVAARPDGGMYATQARWWLDAMTARRSLEADLHRVTQSLQSLEQQTHDSATP
jgi:hypothetical protein